MTVNFSDYLKKYSSFEEAASEAALSLNDGDTLVISCGKVDIYPENTFKKHYYVSNNDGGTKSILFPIIEKKNITIDGGGTELICHKGIIPFVIDKSKNICVKNFAIDYKTPFFSQGLIVEADEEHTVLEFDNEEFFCRVKDGKMSYYSSIDGWENTVERTLTMEFDAKKKAPSHNKPAYFPYTGEPKDHGFLSRMYRDVTVKQLSENRIGMYGKLGFAHTVGNYLVCTHSGRHNPGVFVTDSDDVVLKDLTLYHTAAMGIICQTTNNITLERVIADVREGSRRMMSVNADATHFVNCRGKITIADCRFVSMMDDAGNIHGIYLKDPKKTGENSISTTFGHSQQVGMDIFRKGDVASIVNIETLEELCALTVENTELLSKDELVIYFKEPVPEIPEGYVVENISTAPDVHIYGTQTGNNRPRGFLINSRGKALVENCKFYNMYHGVMIGCEMKDWYESGPVGEITVRNCDFNNAAYAGGVAVMASPNICCPEKAGSFNGKILVENNTFTMHEKRLISARNAREVYFRNNTFVCDLSLPSHTPQNERGIAVELCENVHVEDPKEVK